MISIARISESKIFQLDDNEIFVFGSNEAGYHGAGAAQLAYYLFGAEYRRGEGLYGRSYAIPTKDYDIRTLSLNKISLYVQKFIDFAEQHPHLDFLVTEIGCGLAGYKAEDIAPMFKNALILENVFLPKRFIKILYSI